MSTPGAASGRDRPRSRAHERRRGRAAVPRRRRSPRGRTRAPTRRRGEVAVQQLLRLVRLGRDPGALAQLQHRLLRGRRAPAPRPPRGALLSSLRAAAQRAPPRPRAGASRCPRRAAPRSRRRRRVARGVAPARLDLRRADDDLVAQGRRAAVSLPGDEPARPRHARAASSVSAVSPSWETPTSRSRRPPAATSSSAWTASPAGHGRVERRAAPGVEQTRAVGEASVGRDLRQPLGWAATARLVFRRACRPGLYHRAR